MKPSQKYAKMVQWSDEDQCYVGICPDLFYGGCHGDDEQAVFSELCRRVEEVVELHERDGLPLPAPSAVADKVESLAKSA